MWRTQVFGARRILDDEPRMPDAARPPETIVDCPYCSHAWEADPRWISGPCPKCGRMVYRYMDPQHD